MKKRFLSFLLLTIIISCTCIALILGIYSVQTVEKLLAQQKEDVISSVKGHMQDFDKMLFFLEQDLQKSLRKRFKGIIKEVEQGLVSKQDSVKKLKSLAKKYNVTEVYFINQKGKVVNSSFKKDIGLELFDLSPEFKEFLLSVYGQGKIFITRASVSVNTGKMHMYGYYSPEASDYIIEASISLDEYTQKHFSTGFSEFLFDNFFSRMVEQNKYLKEIDVFIASDVPGHSWSLINKGRSFNKSVAFINDLTEEGRKEFKKGKELEVYSFFKLEDAHFAFTNKIFVKSIFDLSTLNSFFKNFVLWSVLIFAFVVGFLFLIFSSMFNKWILNRLSRINRVLSKIAEGEYQAEVRVGGNDDLTRMSENIEWMQGKILEREKRLKESEQKTNDYAQALKKAKDELEERVLERTAELEKALSSVKQLRGMLPICAHCKKIRDDSGYWNQIEQYITEHSEAEFTHGLCPECRKLLYPEYGGKGKKDK